MSVNIAGHHLTINILWSHVNDSIFQGIPRCARIGQRVIAGGDRVR